MTAEKKKTNKWPLSQDQLKAYKQVLYPEISFVQIMQKYSSGVEEISNANFTHRCICPNPKHKNGAERTASFYFSDDNKGFRCFGCGINGDVFDMLSLKMKQPWFKIINDLIEKENLEEIEIDFSAIPKETYSQYLFDINFKLSTMLRNHLSTYENKPSYDVERKWVDSMFRKIDNRFQKINEGDKQKVKEFEIQISMELERRKLTTGVK